VAFAGGECANNWPLGCAREQLLEQNDRGRGGGYEGSSYDRHILKFSVKVMVEIGTAEVEALAAMPLS
jgi:hypothetical protein